MGVATCPTDVVNTPVERVWALLKDPLRYGEWTDLREIEAEPPGAVTPGQVIRGITREVGLTFKATLTILAVDADVHQIEYRSDLPLGIVGRNRIVGVALDPTRCRVSFP
ncbi:MAG TPA: SRPBCC family protein [Chloroflexota bacterium]|nr:SRPBCC family protein [Chloroflexota bacterium]